MRTYTTTALGLCISAPIIIHRQTVSSPSAPCCPPSPCASVPPSLRPSTPSPSAVLVESSQSLVLPPSSAPPHMPASVPPVSTSPPVCAPAVPPADPPKSTRLPRAPSARRATLRPLVQAAAAGVLGSTCTIRTIRPIRVASRAAALRERPRHMLAAILSRVALLPVARARRHTDI